MNLNNEEETNASLKEQIDQKRGQLITLEQDFQNLKRYSAGERVAIGNLSSEKNFLENQIKSLEEINTQKTALLADTNIAIEKAKVELEGIQAKIQESSKKLEGIHTEIEEGEKIRNELVEEKDLVKQSIIDSTNDNVALKNKLENANKTIKEVITNLA